MRGGGGGIRVAMMGVRKEESSCGCAKGRYFLRGKTKNILLIEGVFFFFGFLSCIMDVVVVFVVDVDDFVCFVDRNGLETGGGFGGPRLLSCFVA